MAAVMLLIVPVVGAFAEAPLPDADGTPIVVQDTENVSYLMHRKLMKAVQTSENTPE